MTLEARPASLTASPEELRVHWSKPFAGVVDVLVEGRRVWSTPVRHGSGEYCPLLWPESLRPYLVGEAEVEVRVPGTGEVLAFGAVRFAGADGARVRVTDRSGHPLVVNKWGGLSRSLEAADDLLERLTQSSVDVIALLRELGHSPYLVGGSLLGAMRNGDFLAHDDDVDLAYLSSHSSPADLSLESFEIQRHLESRGLVVVRHSSAHLQVVYYLDDATVDHYVDIFTAFYKDGLYCQPFALRGHLDIADVLPTSTVTLRGREFPAPAVPGAWLTLAYGAWETPDPSFRFVTPEETTRRFHAWFGSFNAGRAFWTAQLAAELHSGPGAASEDVAEFAGLLPPDSLVLEIGAGCGADALALAEQGHRVEAVDYALQYGRPPFPPHPGIRWRLTNLAEPREALRLAVDAARAGRPFWVYGRHALAAMTRQARANLLRLLAVTPRFAGAWFSFDTDQPPWWRHEDPSSWHLPVEVLAEECAKLGLGVEVTALRPRISGEGQRLSAVVRILPATGAPRTGPGDTP